MSTSLAGLSASVTRILSLTGFPKELKTKDIQSAFSEWDNQAGGFKIKWKDDTSLLIVFNDAAVAKRAYLHTLAYPPAILSPPNGPPATIRPYDGPDAQTVIQAVNSRHNSNPSRAHNARSASISVFPNARAGLNLNGNGNGNGKGKAPPGGDRDREPSPTLPSLPTHPTLNALISEAVANQSQQNGIHADPAILATSLSSSENVSAGRGPSIGDPGKRMLGAALGMRHPSLGPRVVGGGQNGNGPEPMEQMQRAMGGLVVAE
ncbi:hypothetical protein EV122DRAFT_259984 [Schizophyllum commune]|uniref:RRM domain-containing protein n=1 Tax=Schizophyllum commune (strain H4-8 / FGSC 9210) TaxID=578458 RepID=D8PMN6_SCHCM|nr:uncharacterized protein SCHCODRAFT_02613073 [Schizophyllum commune H4-8]KAI5898757.1 hypothetical protein SCHCODRAFT_02613073 [Schizophyllum commune H4-8]